MGDRLDTADQLSIREVISRYCWALDTGDVEGFVGCFAHDGTLVWDVFEEPMRWHGHKALRHFAEFFRSVPSTAGRQHHATNTVVEPTPEGASAISYAMVAMRQGDGPHLLHVMGWYEDSFRQQDGRWVLAERVIRDWSGPVLKDIAGQSGEKVARAFPALLAGALYPQEKD